MARYKSMLKTFSIAIAKRKRKCYHDDVHAIAKGSPVLEIKDGPYSTACYCSECTLQMIACCRKNLDEIESAMRQPV